MTLKMAAKKSFASFCQLTGVFESHKKGSHAVTLMYHRVLASDCKNIFIQPGMYVGVDSLEMQLVALQSRFTILTLAELINRIEQDQDCTGCCVLTFDDGWLDNYTEAFPLLNKYQIPATIFLTTGYIGTERHFWPEEVIIYLNQIDELGLFESELLQELVLQMTSKRNSDLFYDEAIQILKTWQPDKRDTLLKSLRKNCQSPPPERQMMNWDEAKAMHESGLVTFGAHTVNHVILDQVSLEEAEREIVQSKNDIINHLGVTPEFFAYPNGNYTPEIKELLKKHGFRAAVTTKKGHVGKNVDLFEIPRIGMHEDVSNTVPMFWARIFLKWF